MSLAQVNTTLVELVSRLPMRGYDRATSATIHIALPSVRCLVTSEREPRLVWQRGSAGAWEVCSFYDLSEREQGDVRADVASGGYSADPRVERVVIDGRGHMTVTWKAVAA